jgi:GrpB-like predicted nucleotidyltransferase (UPF0157 family)
MHVRVLPYDSSWPQRFDLERERVASALGDIVIALHHIGSTAVPGIRAKPIIDLLLEVTDQAELDRCSSRMESLGYEAKGEFGIPGRRYFRRNDANGERTHQVHAFAFGSGEVLRHLAFRDYLIANPEIAESYGDLKQRLAASFPNDIEGYSNGKDRFMKEHEAKALLWRARQPSGH